MPRIGNVIFCQVDEEFMLDEFNLKGISKFVPNLKKIIYYILNLESSESNEDEEMGESEEQLNKYAEIVYGLIHARYIETSKGMKQMVLSFYIINAISS